MSQDLKRPLFFDVQRVKNGPIALVNLDESKKLRHRHGTQQRADDEGESRAAELPASALPMIRSPRPEKPVAKQADLFDYDDLPATPASPPPVTTHVFVVDDVESVSEKPPPDPTPPVAVIHVPKEEAPPIPTAPPVVVIAAPAVAPLSPRAEEKRLPTPTVLDNVPNRVEQAAGSGSDEEETETKNDADSSRVAIEFSGSGGASGGGARQPQEKAIAQHLLRGKFLRKYLHANNLTRKLKETEQALRSAALMGGVPTLKGGGSLFSRSFITKASASSGGGASGDPSTSMTTLVQDLLGEEATASLSDHLPVLRRLSSIDKAINNTAKRIRRMSGIEDPSAATVAATSKPLSPSPAKPNERPHSRKFTPLKAIGEKQPMAFASPKETESAVDSFDSVEDEFGGGDVEAGLPGTKIDPTSAHMMRICQHVIAKRAIKAFLRQELSVITIIEVALRDDTHLMPRWLQQAHASISHSATMATYLQQQQTQSRASTPDSETTAAAAPTSIHQVNFHRVPIKSMRADILEAVSGYLREGDQHLCLEDVYAYALQAERDKLWKRAILLASVCVVLDREFLHGVLLRARCCRRLGLWAQAIKDLAHGISLRADEYKLVLLRSCLYVKMGELENALVDVNRALAFFPKSIDALLLRAEIFHRQDAIGASLQDLTTALLYDPSCWRAYYDRATIRIRAIEGDEGSLNYHWEHMKYEKLLASIIEDYVSAVRKGCQMVEVVETIGDLSVRLMEFTGDSNVLRQVVSNLTHLLQILAHDHRRSFHAAGPASGSKNNRSPSIANAAATVEAVAAAASASAPNGTISASSSGSNSGGGLEQLRSTELARELLVAAIHAQRGRLFVLLLDRASALADFDQAVVTEYHYPVAHFYRGAFATLTTAAPSSTTSTSSKSSDDASAAAALAANLQHLTRCISLDPTIAGAYTVRGALFLRDLKFNSALQDFKAAVATDPTLYEVWLQIALIYLNHYHDSEACVRACTSALSNDSCLARALYLRAEAFTRQGNLRAALKDYGRLTMAQPDDRWAQLMRGRLLLQMKLARPALYAFIQFMELGAYAREQRHQGGTGPATHVGDKRAHLLCGRAYKILARFQQAVDQFQRAATLHPTSENLVLLSESLHSMGDTENSLRVSEKVISADPSCFKGYVRRAQLLVTSGQFQRALAEYSTAIALAPKEARVNYERGIVQMQLYLRWRVAFQLNFEDKPSQAPPANANANANAAVKRTRHRSPFEPRISAIEVETTLGADQINDERTVVQSMRALYAGAIADFCKCIRLDPLASEPYVDRAELYILGEDYDHAFSDFDAAVERNAKCVRAHVNRGVLKCHFAAFAAAIADFDEAIRVDAKLALAYFNRGVCYQKLELYRHADKSYSSCIELAGGAGRNVDAHRNRAIARCHTGTAFHDALADFDHVRQSAPDDDQLHGGLGYVLLQLGRYEDAARCFATYGRLNRDTFADSGNAYFNIASSASQLDQTKFDAHLTRALRLYLRAVRLHPSNLDLRLNLANCLRRMNEPRRAIAQCDAINSVRPLYHASLESKSLCFYQLHRLPEAIEWMNAAIRACVGSSSALQNIFYAFAHTSIHRHALDRKTVGDKYRGSTEPPSPGRSPPETNEATMHEAMSAQLHALRQQRLVVPSTDHVSDNDGSPPKPVSPTATATAPGIVLTGSSKQMLALYMMNRGILYEKMGAWDDAARDYKDAVHFDPLSVQPLLCLATLQLLQRRFDESRRGFERALELEPTNGLAHLNLGVVLLCVDELDGALTHFDAAIGALPACSFAYANKAVALAKRGELPQAEAQLKRAIEALPSRKEYYLTRGKIVAQQKRLQDAMVDFSTALFLGYDGKL